MEMMRSSCSGATTIFEDKRFAKPIITPKTMKNSILIYRQKNYFRFRFHKLQKFL